MQHYRTSRRDAIKLLGASATAPLLPHALVAAETPQASAAQRLRTLTIAAGAFAALHWLSPVYILVLAGTIGYFWREP